MRSPRQQSARDCPSYSPVAAEARPSLWASAHREQWSHWSPYSTSIFGPRLDPSLPTRDLYPQPKYLPVVAQVRLLVRWGVFSPNAVLWRTRVGKGSSNFLDTTEPKTSPESSDFSQNDIERRL